MSHKRQKKKNTHAHTHTLHPSSFASFIGLERFFFLLLLQDTRKNNTLLRSVKSPLRIHIEPLKNPPLHSIIHPTGTLPRCRGLCVPRMARFTIKNHTGGEPTAQRRRCAAPALSIHEARVQTRNFTQKNRPLCASCATATRLTFSVPRLSTQDRSTQRSALLTHSAQTH